MLEQSTSPSDNFAPWLLESWERDWGSERTSHIVNSFLKAPSTYLSANLQNIPESQRTAHLEEIASVLGDGTHILPNRSIRVSPEMKGAVNKWPLFDEGMWWVQDISASLPAIALAKSFSTDISSLKVVDMCAAPGGKTAQLVSLGFGKVTALEVSSQRSKRLKKNLERLQMDVEVCVGDGTEWVSEDRVDGILLDVPCSATGTGAKRPDVLQKTQDLDTLLDVQARLAQHCVENILQPGGILVYATCSILRRESEDQVDSLLRRNEDALEIVPFQKGEIPGFDDAIDENGWLRVIPGEMIPSLESDCDGFFVARLRRT